MTENHRYYMLGSSPRIVCAAPMAISLPSSYGETMYVAPAADYKLSIAAGNVDSDPDTICLGVPGGPNVDYPLNIGGRCVFILKDEDGLIEITGFDSKQQKRGKLEINQLKDEATLTVKPKCEPADVEFGLLLFLMAVRVLQERGSAPGPFSSPVYDDLKKTFSVYDEQLEYFDKRLKVIYSTPPHPKCEVIEIDNTNQ